MPRPRKPEWTEPLEGRWFQAGAVLIRVDAVRADGDSVAFVYFTRFNGNTLKEKNRSNVSQRAFLKEISESVIVPVPAPHGMEG